MSIRSLKTSRATMLRSLRSTLLLGAACGLLMGCAAGPDFRIPDLSAPETFLPEGDKTPGTRTDVVTQTTTPAWWQGLRSEKLRHLIEETLAHNADLEAAAAGVRLAQANADAQRGALLPMLTGTFDTQRQKIAQGTVTSPVQSNANLFSLHTAQLNVAYTLDWAGGVRRSVEASQAQADLQAYVRDGLALTLASNVGTAAVQEASLRAQINVTNNMISIQQQLLRILQRQNEAGQISMADVAAQETALAQTRLLLAPLEKQLEQQRNLLSVLTGRFPAEGPLESFRLEDFNNLPDAPVATTGEFIAHRPDIRAAGEQLRAANAQVGIAIANRLPQITLTGQVGSSASAMNNLFNPGTGLWNLAGGVVQPIFDAGALANKQVAAEEGFNQALAQYRSTVLVAFQNVADALRALQADARSISAARAAVAAANRNLSLVRKQVENGQVSAPALVTAQQAYLQTSLTLVQAQASRQANYFALLQALGGGWWSLPQQLAEAIPQDAD